MHTGNCTEQTIFVFHFNNIILILLKYNKGDFMICIFGYSDTVICVFKLFNCNLICDNKQYFNLKLADRSQPNS